jgi:hypothetical protein
MTQPWNLENTFDKCVWPDISVANDRGQISPASASAGKTHLDRIQFICAQTLRPKPFYPHEERYPVIRRQKTVTLGAVFGVLSSTPQHVSLAALNSC